MEIQLGRIVIDTGTRTIPEKILSGIKSGCLNTLIGLGVLHKDIKLIKAVFPDDLGRDPFFQIHFNDSIDNRSPYEISFKFIGSGSRNPTAKEIEEALCAKEGLPHVIGIRRDKNTSK